MNLDTLKGSLGKNKTALGAAGALVVVLLALRSRSKAAAAGTSSSTPAVTTSGVSPMPSYYTAGNGSASGYDSTASDVYNAIQPQLEQLKDLYSTIPVPGSSTTPTPAPAPTAPDGFYQAAGDQAIYQFKNGVLDFLTNPEAIALGYPNPTIVTKRDPIWKAPLANPGMTIPWAPK